MEFIKHLKNKYDNTTMIKKFLSCGYTQFDLPQISDGILFKNGLVLSIQGSYGHYCRPRKTLSYDQYDAMEFALIDNNGFKNVKEYFDTTEYDDYFDGSVYGFVPVEMIEKLYQDLKAKYGLLER